MKKLVLLVLIIITSFACSKKEDVNVVIIKSPLEVTFVLDYNYKVTSFSFDSELTKIVLVDIDFLNLEISKSVDIIVKECYSFGLILNTTTSFSKTNFDITISSINNVSNEIIYLRILDVIETLSTKYLMNTTLKFSKDLDLDTSTLNNLIEINNQKNLYPLYKLYEVKKIEEILLKNYFYNDNNYLKYLYNLIESLIEVNEIKSMIIVSEHLGNETEVLYNKLDISLTNYNYHLEVFNNLNQDLDNLESNFNNTSFNFLDSDYIDNVYKTFKTLKKEGVLKIKNTRE